MARIPTELIEVDPVVQRRWEAHLAEGDIRPDEPYNGVSILATILVGLHPDRPSAAFFAALEESLVTADATQRSLLIVGLIEDVQTAALNADVDLRAWESQLGSETHAAWQAVNRLWQGTLSPASFKVFVDG